jgi:predicted unusual protein kinase regulating ubiquinone biosynthesis (AarF/ABC1/UbiB family)
VVVPEVLLDLCTDNVIVMEWIEGTKLTHVTSPDTGLTGYSTTTAASVVAENLQLVELCIQCTLSQLFETGYLHGKWSMPDACCEPKI